MSEDTKKDSPYEEKEEEETTPAEQSEQGVETLDKSNSNSALPPLVSYQS